MNVDVGGGTSKIAVCEEGAVVDLTAIDVGARVVSFDTAGRVTRVEEAAEAFARRARRADCRWRRRGRSAP